MNIGIIGCGNGIFASKKINNPQLIIFDIDREKINPYIKQYPENIIKCDTAEYLVKNSVYIIIAVKPQNFTELFSVIGQLISSEHIIISIAAGISIERIEMLISNKMLKNNQEEKKTAGCFQQKKYKIARIMPNTPALVFQGMSAIAFNNNLIDIEKDTVLCLFSALGKILITDESKINSITAVSGSGPAYVFYFAECFIKAAETLGFTPADSKLLVYQTLLGSAKLLEKSEDSPQELRKKVTSPGGTTEAAFTRILNADIDKTFIDALTCAKIRADELGAK